MRNFVIILMFWATMVTSALAGEDSVMKALSTGNDSRGWEAVGRLNIGGSVFCTGAMIAPDLVLTAAHCLFDKKTGRAFDATDIEFLAGWRNGRANAYRGVSRAIPHPEFEFQTGEKAGRVAFDLALLRLDKSIRSASVRPFETTDKPRKGAAVGVVSYAHDRPDRPTLQQVCHVLARQSGTLVLSCDVDFGSSGAPVFTFDADGNAQIVSVISSKADVRGMAVALGTSLEKPLAELRALMMAEPADTVQAGPKVRIMSQNAPGAISGARFLRP